MALGLTSASYISLRFANTSVSLSKGGMIPDHDKRGHSCFASPKEFCEKSHWWIKHHKTPTQILSHFQITWILEMLKACGGRVMMRRHERQALPCPSRSRWYSRLQAEGRQSGVGWGRDGSRNWTIAKANWKETRGSPACQAWLDAMRTLTVDEDLQLWKMQSWIQYLWHKYNCLEYRCWGPLFAWQYQ